MESEKIKILVIDDNKDNLTTMRALINESFPEAVILTAQSGMLGLEIAVESEPDVILLDIVMPGVNGFEVCKKLKSSEKLSEIPVIFITSNNGDKENRVRALEAGGEAFLAKPVDESELTAQIRAMMKINNASKVKKNEKARLERLVEERTKELYNTNIATLNLLEDLKTENEKWKDSEAALKISEEKFRNIFLNHAAVKFIIDPENGNIVEANSAAANFYGWSVDELKKMNITQLNTLHPAMLEKEIDNALHLNKIQFEFKHRKADGGVVDVEVFSSKIEIGGKPYLHSIIHDITEKKIAEANIKLLNRAIEQSSVSVMITDAKGNLQYVNPFFTEVTGYNYQEVIGQNPRLLKSGRQTDSYYEELWSTILSGREWEGELQNKKKNGELYWERAVISPIVNKDGVIEHFVAIKENITEKKKIIEELIAAKEKAEQSDKLKTEFLAQMSHEIRSPMNAIMSFSNILREELDSMINNDMREYFDGIESAGLRLIRTVDMILNSSELQIGTYEPVFEEFGLIGEIITRIEDDYKLSLKEKDLKYSFSSNVKETKIYGDKYTVFQLFVNLIDNAVKYTKQGSISVSMEKNDKSIMVTIEDTGIGMSEEFMSKLYQPFTQEERGYSRSYEGNGLGLSLVKKYCELNGISIEIESKKGTGTKVTLLFTEAG